jgi:hypothetical protein
MQLGGPLEAVATPLEEIDHVDLQAGIAAQVSHRGRRRHVHEHQVIVVVDQHRPLRRQVWRTVLTHHGDESQLGTIHNAAHVLVDDAHRAPRIVSLNTTLHRFPATALIIGSCDGPPAAAADLRCAAQKS